MQDTDIIWGYTVAEIKDEKRKIRHKYIVAVVADIVIMTLLCIFIMFATPEQIQTKSLLGACVAITIIGNLLLNVFMPARLYAACKFYTKFSRVELQKRDLYLPKSVMVEAMTDPTLCKVDKEYVYHSLQDMQDRLYDGCAIYKRQFKAATVAYKWLVSRAIYTDVKDNESMEHVCLCSIEYGSSNYFVALLAIDDDADVVTVANTDTNVENITQLEETED